MQIIIAFVQFWSGVHRVTAGVRGAYDVGSLCTGTCKVSTFCWRYSLRSRATTLDRTASPETSVINIISALGFRSPALGYRSPGFRMTMYFAFIGLIYNIDRRGVLSRFSAKMGQKIEDIYIYKLWQSYHFAFDIPTSPSRVMTGRPPPRGRSEGPPPRGRTRGVSWVAGGG